mgnify:CR=1 FL=1|jgi:hypothetical protein
MNEELDLILSPVLTSECSLKELRTALREMFVLAVANAPDNETDNFTAKRLSPAYLALAELLDNVPERQ